MQSLFRPGLSWGGGLSLGFWAVWVVSTDLLFLTLQLLEVPQYESQIEDVFPFFTTPEPLLFVVASRAGQYCSLGLDYPPMFHRVSLVLSAFGVAVVFKEFRNLIWAFNCYFGPYVLQERVDDS